MEAWWNWYTRRTFFLANIKGEPYIRNDISEGG